MIFYHTSHRTLGGTSEKGVGTLPHRTAPPPWGPTELNTRNFSGFALADRFRLDFCKCQSLFRSTRSWQQATATNSTTTTSEASSYSEASKRRQVAASQLSGDGQGPARHSCGARQTRMSRYGVQPWAQCKSLGTCKPSTPPFTLPDLTATLTAYQVQKKGGTLQALIVRGRQSHPRGRL